VLLAEFEGDRLIEGVRRARGRADGRLQRSCARPCSVTNNGWRRTLRSPWVIFDSTQRSYGNADTLRLLSGCTGRALSPMARLSLSTCFWVTRSGSRKTIQRTPSVHGGVVTEPL